MQGAPTKSSKPLPSFKTTSAQTGLLLHRVLPARNPQRPQWSNRRLVERVWQLVARRASVERHPPSYSVPVPFGISGRINRRRKRAASSENRVCVLPLSDLELHVVNVWRGRLPENVDELKLEASPSWLHA